jgi:hypothetical protein
LDAANRQHLVLPYLKKYDIQGEVVSITDPAQGKWILQISPRWNGSLPGTLFLKGDKQRKFYGYPLTLGELERNTRFIKDK